MKQHINDHTSKEKLVRHSIDIEENSFVHSLYGNKAEVNSIHHQAVNRVAEGFKVTAVSEDGTVEAIEKGNLIGLQWHPELLAANNIPAQKIFKKFIKYVTEK